MFGLSNINCSVIIFIYSCRVGEGEASDQPKRFESHPELVAVVVEGVEDLCTVLLAAGESVCLRDRETSDI